MSSVPASGLPNTSNLVGGIVIPTRAASPPWSINANSVSPLARRMAWIRSTVASTE